MAYLVDTNVLSELRKGQRCRPSVATWFAAVDEADLYLSVLVIGELQRGVDRIRRRDAVSADALDRWLSNLTVKYAERILPITLPIARLWGSFGVPDPLPTVDGLLAATALHHDLVLATRNTKDVVRTRVQLVNPFDDPPGSPATELP
jgi:predicted nucleic acid-binding protein